MGVITNPVRFTANSALTSPSVGDLYLPVYGGEILARYSEYTGITRMVRKRSITTGDTATFPRTGGIGVERHAAGTQLLGLDVENTELSIQLDERPLITHVALDDIDEMLSHFEVRSEYARQRGEALAEAQDQLTLRLLINASKATPSSLYGGSNSSFPGGGIDGAGNAETGNFAAVGATPTTDQVGALLTAMDNIQIRWDEVRVPFNARNALFEVRNWHGIRQFGSPRSDADLGDGRSPLFMNTEGRFGPGANQTQFPTQAPDFQQAIAYNGFMIWRSNIVRSVYGEDLSGDTEPAKYNGDFSATRGIAWQEEACAVLEKLAITQEVERRVSFQDWLMLSKMLTGGGTLRAECAVEIAESA